MHPKLVSNVLSTSLSGPPDLQTNECHFSIVSWDLIQDDSENSQKNNK